jgi:uncharacterized membrane protein
MKDITITGSRIKKELIIFGICLLAATGLNTYSISKYETDWSELIGQLHIVLLIAIVIYVLVLLFRLLFLGFTQINKTK